MTTSLDTLFDLSLARTQLARDVDHSLSLHGISLSDLAILRELRSEPTRKLRRSELAERLGITPSFASFLKFSTVFGASSSKSSISIVPWFVCMVALLMRGNLAANLGQ